nr:MAG TPA: hypothetical protein [Caudoviricetes sp.]
MLSFLFFLNNNAILLHFPLTVCLFRLYIR